MRFLFVDRIVQLQPGESIKGIKHITPDDAFLSSDEQDRFYFVPSLIGETLGQLAAWNVMLHNQFQARPVAGVVASARLHRPAYVGETLLLESYIDCLDAQAVQYHSVARVSQETVFTIEGALGPLLSMDDFIDQELVRRQFSEINRPGDWETISHNPSEMNNIKKPQAHCHLTTSLRFDHILSLMPGHSVTAEKRISRMAGYFDDHFPRKPVLPMTVLLECKLNLAKDFIQQSHYANQYQFKELRRVKMNEFVHPGDVLLCEAKIKQQGEEELILNFRSTVSGRRVCVAEAVFTQRG
ncbi:hydroxymyristoyl-ACP dehydratase [Legionella israelensis]|uniref:hydroxymyristoyl-ACP dehydratase n=1 Tax=Legionella israelensis TaxID=454 RepID=UPI001180838C|nr:hydroxymyristoyl-ACP dehydratase [Legionella israelensis]QDP71675.1 hydroxymyristoyl-ACP dehydratase [Legionella israelensis]